MGKLSYAIFQLKCDVRIKDFKTCNEHSPPCYASLGGAIGTGLFLGSGEVIAQTGPIGAIIAYVLGGLIAYMVMLCLANLPYTCLLQDLLVHTLKNILVQVQVTPFLGCIGLHGQQHLVQNLRLRLYSCKIGFHTFRCGFGLLFFAIIIFGLNISSTVFSPNLNFWLALVKVITVIAFIILGLLAIFGLIPFHGSESAPLFHNLTAHGWFPQGLVPIFHHHVNC